MRMYATVVLLNFNCTS